MNLATTSIAIIGSGHMATYILNGLQQAGFPLSQICITDKDPQRLTAIAQRFSVHTERDNVVAIKNAQLVILAIKPQSLAAFAKECAGAFAHAPLIISILAGMPIKQLSLLLGEQKFIRAMPNVLVSLSQGNTILFTEKNVLPHERNIAQDFFEQLGIIQWVDEEKEIEAYTILTGCGPGYLFFIMQCIIDAAVELGIPSADAKLSVLQLFSGAAHMALLSDFSLLELQQQVTSKKGVTEKLLAELIDQEVHLKFKQAFSKAHEHGHTLKNLKEES